MNIKTTSASRGVNKSFELFQSFPNPLKSMTFGINKSLPIIHIYTYTGIRGFARVTLYKVGKFRGKQVKAMCGCVGHRALTKELPGTGALARGVC